MALLEIVPRAHAWEGGAAGGWGKRGARYAVEAEDGVGSYFPGRGARVVVEREGGATVVVGTLGVLHPRVLANFELAFPASVLELNLEALV